MESVERHRAEASRKLRVGVVTVSTSKFKLVSEGKEAGDVSGDKAVDMISKAGHTVISKKIVDDEVMMIRFELLRMLEDEGADAVIITGGTGLAARDVTVEAVRPMMEKVIEGFGEIFRLVSFQKVGGAAFLSRAFAGVLKGTVVFCLPGSPNAVETALTLILPELAHAVHMARS